MCFRPYDATSDREAAQRIWRETGWLRAGHEPVIDDLVAAGRSWVAELDGQAECLVTTASGTVRHGRDDLPMTCVTSVTTSHVARRRALAGRLTASALAADVADGALVASLGMFEQGFYDRLGFGTGSYEHRVSFDPTRLKADGAHRAPKRLTRDDWARIHACRLSRRRGHGACNLDAAAFTRADMVKAIQAFGLGYFDGEGGELSHHVWFSTRDVVEHGPYTVRWIAWRTPDQFRELLALIRSLGDQVKLVTMREPPGIQWQDVIEKPIEALTVTRGGELEQKIEALAYWQMRICDVARCLERTRLPGGDVRFNARLRDPIERFLPEGGAWRGAGGDWVVTLGAASGAEPGHDPALPVLECSINAFTRLWLGVRPATGLAHTDDLSAPPELLERLDEVVALPPPRPDWDF